MNWTVVFLIILGLVILRYLMLAYYPEYVNGYVGVFVIVVFLAGVITQNWLFAIGLAIIAVTSRYMYIQIKYKQKTMNGVDPREFNNVANTLAFVIMLLVVVCISWIFTDSSLHPPQKIWYWSLLFCLPWRRGEACGFVEKHCHQGYYYNAC